MFAVDIIRVLCFQIAIFPLFDTTYTFTFSQVQYYSSNLKDGYGTYKLQA